MTASATAKAHANLAFIKYWGKADASLNLPLNGSISMNLSAASTITSVSFDESLLSDQVYIHRGAQPESLGQLELPLENALEQTAGAFAQRVSKHLDRLRSLANTRMRARIVTANSFPASTGIASSASGLAALTLAAATALKLDLSERELTVLARRGSGSACRSIPAGFVEWYAAVRSEDSYAAQLAPPEHWPIIDLAVIVSHGSKKVSSSEGHELVTSSPFWKTRQLDLPDKLKAMRHAILERDFSSFGQILESEALAMHAIALTSAYSADDGWYSGIYYWLPDTLELLLAVQEWRSAGLPVYFTLDAGPTVHLLCPAEHADALSEAVHTLAGSVEGRRWELLRNMPAPGAQVLKDDGATR